MATRFYLSSTATPSVSPPFFGTWTRTTEGDRRVMSTAKDASAMADKTVWAGGSAAADESALTRQYVSAEMAAGVAFNTADTFKLQVRCKESGTDDNVGRVLLGIKVYASDGTTLRATLLAVDFYGPTINEWATSLTNRQGWHPSFSLDVGYTTVAGDILVIEVGAKAGIGGVGGATVTGTMSFGADHASDLPENETTTTANNPWFEISRDITFQSASSDVLIQGLQSPPCQVGPQTAVRLGGLLQE